MVQLVRREHEREVFEPAEVVRPALDAREPHLARVAQHRGVDDVLADAGAPEAADELLHACRARPHATATSSRTPTRPQPGGPPDREHRGVRGEADDAAASGPRTSVRQHRRRRARRRRRSRAATDAAHDAADARRASRGADEHERARDRHPGRETAEPEALGPPTRSARARAARALRAAAASARGRGRRRAGTATVDGDRRHHPRREVDDEAPELGAGAAAVARAEHVLDDRLAREREDPRGRRDEREGDPRHRDDVPRDPLGRDALAHERDSRDERDARPQSRRRGTPRSGTRTRTSSPRPGRGRTRTAARSGRGPGARAARTRPRRARAAATRSASPAATTDAGG